MRKTPMPNASPFEVPPLPFEELRTPLDRSEPDRHATAIAEIRRMRDELVASREEVTQLRADLHHVEDRCTILVEERDRYRAESVVFRTKLIELATAMSNIGLLTTSAQDVMRTVHDLNSASTDALTQLEAAFTTGHHEGTTR